MTDDDSRSSIGPLATFAKEMRTFRVSNGDPSLRQLQDITDKIGQNCAKRYGNERLRNLPRLGRTTIGDLLRGVRWPSGEQLSSFVLSCQFYAEGAGLENPGPETLQRWHDRLAELKQEAARQKTEPTPARHDKPEPADLVHDTGGAVDASRLIMLPRLDLRTICPPPADVSPSTLSRIEKRFRAYFGSYGLQLIADADAHHLPEAQYRVAVLLYLIGRPREALAWLMAAVEADYLLAIQLSDADDPVGAAVEHAYRLATFAFAADDYAAAYVFYLHAARYDHVDATFGLGLLYITVDMPRRALACFEKAAFLGHEYAMDRIAQIRSVLDGPDTTPPWGRSTVG